MSSIIFRFFLLRLLSTVVQVNVCLVQHQNLVSVLHPYMWQLDHVFFPDIYLYIYQNLNDTHMRGACFARLMIHLVQHDQEC